MLKFIKEEIQFFNRNTTTLKLISLKSTETETNKASDIKPKSNEQIAFKTGTIYGQTNDNPVFFKPVKPTQQW